MRALPHSSRTRRNAGFTLVEMLVVLVIVGLIVYSMVLGFGTATQAKVVRTTNQLAQTIRFAYDRARFTGRNYRLHINLDNGSFALQAADERMYLPATDRNGEIFVLDESDAREREARDKAAEERYNSSIQSQVLGDGQADPLNPYAPGKKSVPRRKPPLFNAFDDENVLSELGKPIVFPGNVRVVSVQTDAEPEPITTGEADLYFFPRGQTQLAHIQLADQKHDNYYTIVVQPLTGKVTVKDGLVPLELPEEVLDREDGDGRQMTRRSF